MKKTIALLLLFIAGANQLKAAVQTIRFDVFLFGNKIGHMTVTREEKPGGIELYTLSSHTKAKFLWSKREDTTRYEVTYKDGRLLSSLHKEYQNGELKRWTTISRNGDVYRVDSYKGKRTFTEAPVQSVVTLYFKGVQSGKRLFYEAEADFDEIEHPEPNTWQFKSSDGNRNIYHYENGQVKDTEFKVTLATIKMVRNN